MHFHQSRAVEMMMQQRREEFLSAMTASIPRLATHAETLAYFMLITVFWGMIVYFGMLAAGH
jgi:hypothetical protein